MHVLPKGNNRYYEYQKSFRRNKYKILNIYFSKEKDKDLIDYLNGIKDKTQYIKRLIEKDKES